MKVYCPNNCGVLLTPKEPHCPACGAVKYRKTHPQQQREKMIDRRASDSIFKTMQERGIV